MKEPSGDEEKGEKKIETISNGVDGVDGVTGVFRRRGVAKYSIRME